MGTIFGREPVAIAAFIGIAMNLAMTFGLNLSAEQVALINALVVAGLALLVHGNVYIKPSVQKIANDATFQPAGTVIDIGNPPSGEG